MGHQCDLRFRLLSRRTSVTSCLANASGCYPCYLPPYSPTVDPGHGKLAAGQNRCLEEVGLERLESSCGQRGAAASGNGNTRRAWCPRMPRKPVPESSKQLALVQYSVPSFSAAFTLQL